VKQESPFTKEKQKEQRKSHQMRKITPALLMLIALVALGGSVISVFARQPAGSQPFNEMVHRNARVYLQVHNWNARSFRSGGGLTATQLRKAYGLDKLPNQGGGITVAVIDAFGNPNAQVDLNKYSATFGLPSAPVRIVYPQGKPATINRGWALESNLDVQMVHAMAPNAKIVLEAARSATFADIMGAVKDAYTHRNASIISMSFGGSEFSQETGPNADGILAAGGRAGVTFTVSSGDRGAGAQYPAASPFVTAVGGTSLHLNKRGGYLNETAWSGSGGGMSVFEKRPAYQNGFNGGTGRGIPDVAMAANPNIGIVVYDSFGYNGQSGFFSVGGTSASAPMFAGVVALSKQLAKNIRIVNRELYQLARMRYRADFHDITIGNNGNCGAECQAQPGYDFVTGLGSPIANNLVPDIAAVS
jgi:subtilase family serine protease